MDSFRDIFLWAAIPIAVLLLAGAASAYGLTRRRPRENPQDRVARAYRAATSRAARDAPARQPARPAPQVFAAQTQAGQPQPSGAGMTGS